MFELPHGHSNNLNNESTRVIMFYQVSYNLMIIILFYFPVFFFMLYSLSVGQYLLSHAVGGTHATIKKTTTSKK